MRKIDLEILFTKTNCTIFWNSEKPLLSCHNQSVAWKFNKDTRHVRFFSFFCRKFLIFGIKRMADVQKMKVKSILKGWFRRVKQTAMNFKFMMNKFGLSFKISNVFFKIVSSENHNFNLKFARSSRLNPAVTSLIFSLVLMKLY